MDVLVLTHGSFAQGIVSALEIIVGKQENVSYINAYLDEQPVADKIEHYLEGRDKVLVLTDMLGGSVNQAITQYLNKKDLKIVTGINLPLILELVLMNNHSELTDDMIRSTVLNSQSQIQFVNDAINQELNDDFE